MPLQVVCPGCGNRLPVDDSLTGKQIRCGGCECVIDVPKPNPKQQAKPHVAPVTRTPSPQPAATTVEVICPCRAKLTLPISARGTHQRCPTCHQSIYVPSPAAPRPPAAMSTGIGSFSHSLSQPLPASKPLQNPYRRPVSKPANNTPIVLTAVIGVAALLLVVGGVLAFQLLPDNKQASVESPDSVKQNVPDEDADQSLKVDPHDATPTGTSAFQTSDPAPVRSSPTEAPSTPAHQQSESAPIHPVTMTTTGKPPEPDKQTTPKSAAPTQPQPARLRSLEPGNDQGLYRVHLPEGYSFAVPAGFTPQPRAINGKTGIYTLNWADGTTLIFNITDNRNVTADTPVPGALSRSFASGGKTTVRPLSSASNPNQIETVKLDGMNACFVEMEQDISHPDRTEELQRLYSGAMPAEAKRQLADQMRAVTAFRAASIMRAMDERRILDVVIIGTRGQPFSPPEQWYNILRTIRHESAPDPRRIPPQFAKRR